MPVEVPREFNLASFFLDRHLEEGRGERIAISGRGTDLTYSRLAELANRVGNGLRKLGLQQEQRVLIVLPDSPEFVAAFFGAVKIGAVAVPTNTVLRSDDYSRCLKESRAQVLFVHCEYLDRLRPALEGQDSLREIIVCGKPVQGYRSWKTWLGEQSAALQAARTGRNDVAFWLWTSGSTGTPRAAVHLHRDWVYCCEYYARGVLGIEPPDLTFSTSKLFHAYGLGNGLMFPFYVGAGTTYFPDRPTAQSILQAVHERRPTLFFSVPTLYAAMLQETDQDNPYDLSGVRLGVSAAEPLPAGIFRRWKQRFGFEVLDGVGSTEILHIYASARPGQVRPGSAGFPVPGYELRITDEAGREIADAMVGDLWVKGESTAVSYWNRRRLTRERMQGNWFLTGDKFYRDPDGYLWYAGRGDDMFRVSGQWLSPIEVEAALIEHPAVLEAAVVAYEDQNRLLKPRAYVVLKPGQKAGKELAEELQSLVRERLSPYKYPRRVDFVPGLPKTAVGKIQRYKLRFTQGAEPAGDE